jgi:hypothetical protein
MLSLGLIALCTLSAQDRRLVDQTLLGWSDVSREALALPPAKPPLILLLDRKCTYTIRPDPGGAFQVGGVRLGIRGRVHGDSVRFPNGATVPVAGMAFTSLFGKDDEPFFVAALPEVWAADPKYRDDPENWARFLPPVMIHELTHTRQLAAIVQAIEPSATALELTSLDDDLIQRRFQDDSLFTAGIWREVDLLFQAARQPDACRRRTLVGEALVARAERHARWFAGADSSYRTIETRFLDMEGVAQWAALQFLHRHPEPGETAAAQLDRIRDNKKWWSQEYGLALYLALDASVSGWQRTVFPPTLESAFDLLETFVRGDGGTGRPPC